ncbi:MAG: preprotein translocase subunit SecY [Planctomycetaceae bacterium]|jgi:preprotein translocase subunit SecY|nr:preprotein translocase subunit SecY [Planctomycetaceae bacterium]
MLQKIRIIFSIPELRQKILLTLGLLAIYRVGFIIPLPVINVEEVQKFWQQSSAEGLKNVFQTVAMLSGANFEQMTIFGLGIMPYISASIIFQLLGTVIPKLAEYQKEGESGRRKINEYTRYATIPICMIQSLFAIQLFANSKSLINPAFCYEGGGMMWSWMIATVLIMTAGTAFLMWLGEQIDEYGIGNGISLIIMAGILANMPSAINQIISQINANGFQVGSQMGPETVLMLLVMYVAVVVGVIYITKGQRRIPTQSAKHIRGNRVYGGGSRQYLPLKINQAGVMPIIFASSLLLFPTVFLSTIKQFYPQSQTLDWWTNAFSSPTAYVHATCYIALIFFFCYFWTAITFNPKDVADNLKNHGSFIPGYRPGNTTAQFLERVMIHITYVGSSFLAIIAIIPAIISGTMGVSLVVASFFGGTGLLIAVSVAIDLIDKIDSHLIMRNYKGLLDKSN